MGIMTIEAARQMKIASASAAGFPVNSLDLSDEACQRLIDWCEAPLIEGILKEFENEKK
jgi:hypothetical protein